MKNTYSSSINKSLNGRDEDEEKQPTTPETPDSSNTEQAVVSEPVTTSSKTDKKGNQDKGLGKNIDGSFKQSNAGRRVMEKAKRKVQLSLTLTPATKEALDEWASTKPRSTANYISEYVEEHFEEIMNYFNK